MRPLLQAFSSGLFIAVLAMGVIYYTDSADSSAESDEHTPGTEEMIAMLESGDYIVRTETEWEQLQKQEQEQGPSTEETPQTIRVYEVDVTRGMSSKDISENLQEASIIQDADAFNDYLIDNGFSKKIQTGSFLVEDRMTMSEIAETLTSQ